MKRLFTLFICSLLIAIVNAQSSYYYYNGGKIPLTLNENKVVINIPKTCEEVSNRIQTNVQVLNTISDSFFQSFVITRSDFEKLGSLDSWEEDEKSVILTSSYYTENNEEVYATPYLSVRLKKEEDIDLLASYVEKYKLRFGDYKPLLPLWYVLSVTLESEKSPLQIANELYETGDFVAAAPDLADAPDNDEENEYPTIVSSYNEYYRQRLGNNAEWFFEEIPYPKQCLKHWEMYYHMRYGGSPKWSYYIEDGDSVIDNTSYTPVTISGDTLLYRQDGNKVFFKPKDYSPKEEILVLDYGLNPGDEFYTYKGKIFLVTKVEYAIEENVEASENGLKYWKYQDYAHFYGKRPPKIIHLKNEKNGEEDIWIEGFGSLNWGIMPIEISYYLDYAVSDFPDIGPVASHTAMASDLFSGVWPTYNNEHYKRVRFEPEDLDMSRYYEENKSTGIEWEDYIKQQFPWTFSFNDDTLCVTGVMELNCLPTYGECIINGDYIDVSIIQYDEGVLDQPDCLYERYVNIKFPNFKSGVYKIGLKNMEHQIVTCGTDDYIPYVAENKEWKLGYRMHSTKGIEEIYTYYFSGDTIINPTDKHIYKKWMRQTTNKDYRQTEYIGAIYEDEKKVYQFMPEQTEAVLIFDFASNVGDTIEVYNKGSQEVETCIIRDKYREPHNYEGIPEFRIVSVEFPEYFWSWVEGLGAVNYWPDKNSQFEKMWFGEYLLMSCIQGNDTLYYRPDLTEDISEYWDEDNETKKQKIDFTHVIKTKPTSPQPVSTNISLLWGEYSNAVLNIDFEGMNGRYKINVRKDGEQQDRFSANQETHNLQSLDVNLAGYPDGDYTVVVENEGESFTAHFALPLDGTGIESIVNSQSSNTKSIYDLSGRRVVNPKRGLYIQGGRKVLIE